MRQRQTHITAVLLAAGDGTRFAGPTHKLLSPLRGLLSISTPSMQ